MRARAIVLSTLIAVVLIIPATHDVGVRVEILPKKHNATQTKATYEQKQANKALAMRYAKAGWGWDKRQRQCIYKLFMKESKFDHLAKNQQGSSAYGIAQMLKETSKDPAVQLLKAFRYIEHRYSTPCKAWKHHSKGWY